jgi:hypothetical protein
MNKNELENLELVCPHCGQRIAAPNLYSHLSQLNPYTAIWNYEYRSRAKIFGWPLVHIGFGINPRTGKPLVAKGIIAIGNFSVGLVAIGGFAVGGITIAGIGLGLLVLAGIAVGGVAIGGIALGLQFAFGGLAISPHNAFGGLIFLP